jgi:hypothetical protein
MSDKLLPRMFIFKEVLYRNSAYTAKRLRHISLNSWNFCLISKFVFIYLFIPQFLAEPLTIACGTLVGKQWIR